VIESYLRQSALDHLALAGRTADADGDAAVQLCEKPLPAAVNLRGNAADVAFVEAVRGALGVAPPTTPNTVASNGDIVLLWLGPDEWLAVQHGGAPETEAQTAATLRGALAGQHAAVTEVGENYACIAVAGPKAPEVIVKGCPLDLHPRAFGGTGHCAQTHLSKAAIILHQSDDAPSFHLYVRRSFSDYLWHWLEDAAREFGVAVVTV